MSIKTHLLWFWDNKKLLLYPKYLVRAMASPSEGDLIVNLAMYTRGLGLILLSINFI